MSRTSKESYQVRGNLIVDVQNLQPGIEDILVASLLGAPEYIKALVLETKAFQPKNKVIVDGLKSGISNPLELNSRAKELNIDIVEHLHFLLGIQPDQVELSDIHRLQNALNEDRVRASLLSGVSKITNLIKDKKKDVSESLTEMSRLVTLANKQLLGSVNPEGTAILNRARLVMSGQRFSSGFKTLDASTNGMKHGHIWLVVGPYKSYKTRTVLHCIDKNLEQGKSIAYIALEDSDVAFTNALIAVHSFTPEFNVEEVHNAGYSGGDEYEKDILAADKWLESAKWRVYDQKHRVHNWSNFPNLVASDKMQYDTDIIVVDFIQHWTEKREDLEAISTMLGQVAAENQVCIIALSQMSNESIKFGTVSNMLGTKQTGSLGAICHVGIEVRHSYEKNTLNAPAELVSSLNDIKIPVGMPLSELEIWVKTIRRGKPTKFYVFAEPWSGRMFYEHDNPVTDFSIPKPKNFGD
ncbi:MAG: DnaB helicase C-terminal domain-containing protein [Thaumarchaeota archaeon]|nr:DnaB helicase C-terminal domain-containing protein [Nitrososphaerota archaeon]